MASGDSLLVPVERKTICSSVLAQLKRLIVEGVWPPGYRIPPERDLAEKLEVGRASVREAVRILEAVGVVDNKGASGRFVSDASIGPLMLLEHVHSSSLDDSLAIVYLYEAREILEPILSRLAAENPSEEGLQHADEILARMEHSIASGGNGAREDREFHIAVAGMFGNPVLTSIERTLISLATPYMELALSKPGHPEASLEEHRAILEAIRANELARAEEATTKHLRHCERETVFQAHEAHREAQT